MSGAGSIKWDGSDEDALYEIKSAVKSFTLKGTLLRDLFTDAARQSKSSVLIVTFSEYDLVARIEISRGIDGWSP